MCKYVKQSNEREKKVSKIVIRGCDRNKETIPPRNENTTTTKRQHQQPLQYRQQ